MAYEPGTTIDLSYLNRKSARSSTSSAGQFLCDIGTHFKFVLTESGYKTARSIPVLAV